MLRQEFIGSALALIIGVNLAAWALTVPSQHTSTPIGEPAMETISQTASVESATVLPSNDTVASSTATTTDATSSDQ